MSNQKETTEDTKPDAAIDTARLLGVRGFFIKICLYLFPEIALKSNCTKCREIISSDFELLNKSANTFFSDAEFGKRSDFQECFTRLHGLKNRLFP